MNIFLDFETYYDTKSKYGLRTLSTQDYITDDRFEVIGVSIAINNGAPQWFTGAEVAPALAAMPWDKTTVVAHNNAFDAAILAWRFRHHPNRLACTMSMATALGIRVVAGGSLDALAKAYKALGHDIPHKGNEVVKADGKALEDFTPRELAEYGEYCKTDTVICRKLYDLMAPQLTPGELYWHDTVLKMYTQPMFILNTPLLEKELVRVRDEKEKLLRTVTEEHGAVLMSNPKFAKLLVDHRVEPPMKVSKTTGKLTFAFSKVDSEFVALAEHDDPRVQALVLARLGTKSTIQESRLERLLQIAPRGPVPMSYLVGGAHTGRLSGGGERNNVQNMPSGRVAGQSKVMRQSIMAPPGMVAGAVDSSNVESRVLAWLANEGWKLRNFNAGIDPYLAAASRMYAQDLDELTAAHKAGDAEAKLRRQAGKSAELGLGYMAGPKGFATYCKDTMKLKVTDEWCAETVVRWRTANTGIVDLWRKADQVIKAMMRGERGVFGGPDGASLVYDGSRMLMGQRVPGVMLPDGYWLNYMNLRQEPDEERGTTIVYDQRKGKVMQKNYLYGGKMIENLCQGLAGAIIKYQAALVSMYYRPLMQTHDEIVVVAPEQDAETMKRTLEDLFAVAPSWFTGVSLKGEAGYAKNYGDC